MIVADKKKLIVISAPANFTDEALEHVLNAPYEEGYYLDRIVDARDGEIRALYRLRVKIDSETGVAAEFVRANPNLTVQQTIAGLAAKGVTRGREWVTRQKRDLV
jgi:hypothetical protein